MSPNEQQKLYEQQACAHIDAELETIRGDLHLLIDFYSGVKKLDQSRVKRTEADDKRFFWTLDQLRERVKKLQKKRIRLLKNLPRYPL